MGFGPVIGHFFFAFAVIADLDRKVGMGMPVIGVAPFVLLIELEEDFFIHPGLDGELGLFEALKLLALFIFPIGGVLLKVLHENPDDFLGPLFHPLDVKVDFGAYLVLGDFVLFGGV